MIAPPKGTPAFAPLFTDHDARRPAAVLQLRAIPARRNPIDSRGAITLREVDDAASHPGAPVIPSRDPRLVPIGEPVEYRIPLVPNARRFAAGHRIQLMLTSDDQQKDVPVFLDYRHVPVGNNSRNTIGSDSRLLLPILS